MKSASHYSRSMRFRSLVTFMLAVAVQMTNAVLACEPAVDLRAESPAEFAELGAAQRPVETGSVDYSLLAEAIFFETNERRSGRGLDTLTHLSELDQAACLHAQAMVENDFFAHRNPHDPALATPADRVRAQDLEVGFVAENIGEVFVLQYESGERVYMRQVDGGTIFSREPGGEPLGKRSYLQVAEALLDGWMSSPGHRRNILAEEAEYFGSGCQLERDEELEMPMLTCAQLFFAPLSGTPG